MSWGRNSAGQIAGLEGECIGDNDVRSPSQIHDFRLQRWHSSPDVVEQDQPGPRCAHGRPKPLELPIDLPGTEQIAQVGQSSDGDKLVRLMGVHPSHNHTFELKGAGRVSQSSQQESAQVLGTAD